MKKFAMLVAFAIAVPAIAQDQTDGVGVTVTSTMPLPEDARWSHAFDAVEGEKGEENSAIRRALFFYRHMEKYGVEGDRVKAAVVIHGPAIFDVVKDERYARAYGAGDDQQPARNPNFNNIAEFVGRGGEIWVCGVSAEYRKVGDDDLLPGVRMAPAAMVAHADLQRRGFSINPY